MVMDHDSDVPTKFTAALAECFVYDAIDQNNFEKFCLIISREGFDINEYRNGRTILLYLAVVPNRENFAAELLHKGANVHQTDQFGRSFLHFAARAKKVNNLKTSKLMIENGIDVNSQDNYGFTPLYTACLIGNTNLIHLLLCYGANPNIASHKGFIPLNRLSLSILDNEYNQILEMLFWYTFDEDESCILLQNLASTMWRDSPLFLKIADRAPKVKYDIDDINYFCENLCDVKGDHFEVFVEKFEEVLEAVMEEVDLLFLVVEFSKSMDFQQSSKILDCLLQSKHVCKLIQYSDPRRHYIRFLLHSFASNDTAENIQNRIFLMLSYGLGVTVQDLEAVYTCYGYCDLFHTLLHMDISPPQQQTKLSMAKLYYDLTLDIQEEFGAIIKNKTHIFYVEKNIFVPDTELFDVLQYFNEKQIKDFYLANLKDVATIQKVREMPEISSLVELSRNTARRYIIDYYNAKTCKEFYCVLNGLPIDRVTRSILALEQKIY